jgi:ESS family glutamate:Na+ symporter
MEALTMDFSAANSALWGAVLQFGLLAALLLLANVLRRKVVFFRKSLMPTAVLAGFLALILRVTGLLHLELGLMEMITYHAIAIGFIAMSLQIPDKKEAGVKGDFTPAKSGALIVSTYLIQGAIGLIITILLAHTVMPGLFKAAGIILPMGYGQGPGQANNVGSTYETLGFAGGQSFGLSIAAAGFLCACLVGVVYLNILKRRGKISGSYEERAEKVSLDVFQGENEIPISESVDRFSLQFALVLLIYLATFLVSKGITHLLATYLPGLSQTVSSLVWGFNFIIGSLLAIVCRNIFNLLTKVKLMTRQYSNNYLLSRIAGLAFDFMVITGIAAIDFHDIRQLWLPFTLLALAGGVVTIFWLQWLCRKIYPDYYYEGFLSMYGMLTGTISSGVLLLREIDPDFHTPAAGNLLTGSSFAIVFGFPMLLLIGLAPESDALLYLTLGLILVYMAALVLFMLLAKRKKQPGAV